MALKDFATSTVATAPSPATSGTSLVVQSGHGARFPATPFFVTAHPDGELPTLDNAEKLQVTNVSTDTFTIVRAQGDTTAKSIATGWRISNAVFVGDIGDVFETATQTLTNKTIDTGSNTLTIGASLDMNSNPITEISRLDLNRTSTTFTASPGNWVNIATNQTFDYSNIILPSAVNYGGTQTLEQDSFIFAMGFLFNANPTIKNANGETRSMYSFYALNQQATFQADNATVTHAVQADVIIQPTWNVINAGTMNVTRWESIVLQGTIGASATVTNRRAVRVNNPTTTGTLTNSMGLVIENLNTGTNNTLISLGTETAAAGNFAIRSTSTYLSTFAGDIEVPDEAYGSGWNGSVEVPTKNAVYDALNGNAIGYVNHGATAGTARPSNFAVVLWYGSVEPTNATDSDIWIDTA